LGSLLPGPRLREAFFGNLDYAVIARKL